jgi:hypothetical protein
VPREPLVQRSESGDPGLAELIKLKRHRRRSIKKPDETLRRGGVDSQLGDQLRLRLTKELRGRANAAEKLPELRSIQRIDAFFF